MSKIRLKLYYSTSENMNMSLSATTLQQLHNSTTAFFLMSYIIGVCLGPKDTSTRCNRLRNFCVIKFKSILLYLKNVLRRDF